MNSKGFMFIETIVMVVVLSVGLLFLYSAYSNSISEEKTRLTYDDTPYIYRTYYTLKFLQENTNINSEIESFVNDNNYIATIGDLFDDNNIKDDFLNIMNDFHIYYIVLVSSDAIIKCLDEENELCRNQYSMMDKKFTQYIKGLDLGNIGENETKYFIAIEYAERFSNNIVEVCDEDIQDTNCKLSFSSLEIKED